MRIVATGFGESNVLQAIESEPRSPTDGEVAVRIHAAGVNHADYKRYSSPDYTKSAGQPPPSFPLSLGIEAAGVVTAVGAKAVGPAGPILVGDEVIAYRVTGSYADSITVPASCIVPKPTKLSWEQAAAIMVAGTTAAHTLAAVCARPGDSVLVHGAAGGVGLAVVQLATRGREDHWNRERERLRSPARLRRGPRKIWGRARGAGEEARSHGCECGDRPSWNRRGDRYFTGVAKRSVEDRTIVAFRRAKETGIQMLGGSSGQDAVGIAIRDNARLRLTALAQAGAFDIKISRCFPLEQAADAHRLLAKGGGGGGHVVLVPKTVST